MSSIYAYIYIQHLHPSQKKSKQNKNKENLQKINKFEFFLFILKVSEFRWLHLNFDIRGALLIDSDKNMLRFIRLLGVHTLQLTRKYLNTFVADFN